MSEYKYKEYEEYENDKLVYSNNDSKYDTKYDTYNDFDSYLLFYFVCVLFASYFCHPLYICTKNKCKKYYDYYKKNKNLKQKLINDSNNDICSICLENLKDDKCVILSCEHIYHKVCIKMWLKNNENCPICRINII